MAQCALSRLLRTDTVLLFLPLYSVKANNRLHISQHGRPTYKRSSVPVFPEVSSEQSIVFDSSPALLDSALRSARRCLAYQSIIMGHCYCCLNVTQSGEGTRHYPSLHRQSPDPVCRLLAIIETNSTPRHHLPAHTSYSTHLTPHGVNTTN